MAMLSFQLDNILQNRSKKVASVYFLQFTKLNAIFLVIKYIEKHNVMQIEIAVYIYSHKCIAIFSAFPIC